MDLKRLADLFVLVLCLFLLLDSLGLSVEANRKRGSKRKNKKGFKKGKRPGKRIPVYRQLKMLRQEVEYIDNRHQLDMDLVMADFRSHPAQVSVPSTVDHSSLKNQVIEFESKLRTINISVNSLVDGLHNEKAMRYKNNQELDKLKMDVDGSINSVSLKIENVQEQCSVDYASLKTIVDENSNDVTVLKKKVEWIMTAIKDLLSSQGLVLKDLHNVLKDISLDRSETPRRRKDRTRPTSRQRDATTPTPKSTPKSFDDYIEDHRVRHYQRDSAQDVSEEDMDVAMETTKESAAMVQTEMMSVLQKMIDSSVERSLAPYKAQIQEKEVEIRKLKEVVGTLYVKSRKHGR